MNNSFIKIKTELCFYEFQDPVKSADEVIKEIDDLIEDSDVEEEELSEHGNQVTVEI